MAVSAHQSLYLSPKLTCEYEDQRQWLLKRNPTKEKTDSLGKEKIVLKSLIKSGLTKKELETSIRFTVTDRDKLFASTTMSEDKSTSSSQVESASSTKKDEVKIPNRLRLTMKRIDDYDKKSSVPSRLQMGIEYPTLITEFQRKVVMKALMDVDDNIDEKRELAKEKVYILLREKQKSRRNSSSRRKSGTIDEKPDLDNTSWMSRESSTGRSRSRRSVRPHIQTALNRNSTSQSSVGSSESPSAISRMSSKLGSSSPIDRIVLSPYVVTATATSSSSQKLSPPSPVFSPYPLRRTATLKRTSASSYSPKKILFTQEAFEPKWEHYDVMKSRWKEIEAELRTLKV